MMKILAAALFFTTSLGFAQGKLVVDSSSISFQIKNAGIIVNGSFTGLDAQVDFNLKKLNNSFIEASIDASSVDTGIRIRNNHLLREDYFDVGVYPRITMRSESFQKDRGKEYVGNFIINLKGKEDHIKLPFSFSEVGENYIFTGTFNINRRNFDIGGESLILDDNVQIIIWMKTSAVKGDH